MRILKTSIAGLVACGLAACSPAAETEEAATDEAEAEAVDTAAAETRVIPLQLVDELPGDPAATLTIGEITYVTEPVTHAVNVPIEYTGCGGEDIGAFWNGDWDKSNPPQIDVHMWLEGGITCEAQQFVQLQVDIADLLQDEPRFTVNVHANDTLAGSVLVGEAAE